ncbi:hypothetical protein PILCRDRAFT_824471 [Piloderma croceum F 1598]|uniref:Uncharacterized protein n=1 Tax=Piloderma croceum (strain F 1598) TaxID=765440 RepID=A0A0C3F8N7_PILCF|nr:hypothetical protein PILCRDRAFT_826612 [Piloderma croceum F 1598]KIM78254.1 hypothetical protein PILCRDRAFT_824471 [Piloderma croceum F 1598]
MKLSVYWIYFRSLIWWLVTPVWSNPARQEGAHSNDQTIFLYLLVHARDARLEYNR